LAQILSSRSTREGSDYMSHAIRKRLEPTDFLEFVGWLCQATLTQLPSNSNPDPTLAAWHM